MIKHFTIFIATIILAVSVSSCNNSRANGEKANDARTSEAAPEKFTLKKDTLETHITIPGELIAYQQVDLYTKVSGFVKDLKVDIGSRVKTGQILLTLEAPEMMAQLSAAESRLKSQEALYTASAANYKRLVQTSKTPGTISQNDLDVAEAKKNSDSANLEAARASFKEVNDVKSYLVIRAPFDGTITSRNITVGSYVGPSGKGSELPALTLQQHTKLRLVFSIPESYSGYFHQGDPITFKVRSYPGENFSAAISRQSGALDTRLRSQRSEADVHNENGKLLAGTVADVNAILRSSPNSFVIPKTALVNSTEAVYVVKVVNGKAQLVNVKKGLESNELVEVFGALSENDVILKKTTDEIKQGQEIK
jgi:membrane fusion protein (multidrug efflux system)